MSIYDNYIQCISENLSLELKDSHFKRDPRYTQILEHVNYAQGTEYLKLKNQKYSHIDSKTCAEIIAENDKYGDPVQKYFNNEYTCSPSNFRYLYQGLEILSYIRKLGNDVDILEIGAGYSALCLFIYRLSKLFPDVKINSYTIIDLELATKLQKKYLDINNIKANFYTTENYKTLEQKPYFLISNYCLAEIDDKSFKDYIQFLTPMLQHGYIAWNNATFIHQFSQSQIVEDEKPLTYAGNKTIWF